MARDAGSGNPCDATQRLQAASGGPAGIGWFATLAERLIENGYEPLPIKPLSKTPALTRWTTVEINRPNVASWTRQYADHGVGLRTGKLVAVDIDILDANQAHAAAARAQDLMGQTLVRVGRWPKRLLVYRVAMPFRKIRIPGLEILGDGQQFVSHGLHPEMRMPYYWVTGDSPCEVAFSDLPLVDSAVVQRFVAEMRGLGEPVPRNCRRGRAAGDPVGSGQQITRDASGQVIDGRDGWLSVLAFHAVHDAIDVGGALDPALISQSAWDRFCQTAELGRGRSGSTEPWSPGDAQQKVTDKLRLHRDGRLPGRLPLPVPAPFEEPPTGDVAEARERLDVTLRDAFSAINAWHGGKTDQTARPVIGIRATFGLGKSTAARAAIITWMEERQTSGRAARVLIVTPSHDLAEEAALLWRACWASTAVLRGYNARDPISGTPMCRDYVMVKMAVRSGQNIERSACQAKPSGTCRHFATCLKQLNRREVAEAEVVIAPYDVLYTGLDSGRTPFALIVIDEACWPRAVRNDDSLTIADFAAAGALNEPVSTDQVIDTGDAVDLRAFNQYLAEVLETAEPGPLDAGTIARSQLTRSDCRRVASILRTQRPNPQLSPGMPEQKRAIAAEAVRKAELALILADIWDAVAALLSGEPGGIVLRITGEVGSPSRKVVLHGLRRLHRGFSNVPVLHLDGTLRSDLARRILPDLTVTSIEVGQPHATINLVIGSFGKSALCPRPHGDTEDQHRRRRLDDCVTYVAWQAAAAAPGRTLVVTYKDIEPVFRAIPGVETGHFNAIAGLDRFRDVAKLIVIGRPLPSESDLAGLTASVFGRYPDEGYRKECRSVRLVSGESASVMVVAHAVPDAELLRAAICDDEVIQAIGRGRGINRTPDTPLDIHVLANLALPLPHHAVTTWEAVVPDLLQRMLLSGLAVDSPADAAALHPALFTSAEQAKKAFERTAFKGQAPLRDIYKGLSLKSARYRRSGRGRSWQRVWWLTGSAEQARQRLEARLGQLAGWEVAG